MGDSAREPLAAAKTRAHDLRHFVQPEEVRADLEVGVFLARDQKRRMPLPPALALSLFYLATFAVLGVYLPYLNLYLEGLGLTGLQIGMVSSLVPLCGALAPALGGVLSDRLGRRRGLVVLSTLLAL